MANACNSDENSSLSTDASFEISDTSDFSIDLNGESIDEEEVDNVLGVVPYQFEPEYASDDPAIATTLSTTENDSRSVPDDETLLTNLDSWCKCGHCVIMDTALECVCCHTVNVVDAKLTDPDVPGEEFECVTDHPAFEGGCLNVWALKLAFMAYHNEYDVRVDGTNNEKYRYIAYRQFVRWCWGRLGKHNRRVLPACVVTAIRKAFPSDVYTGFQLPILD